jgi:hypothetical protein
MYRFRSNEGNEINLKQWLYRGGRPNRVAGLLNRGWAAIHALGVAPNYLVTLEVTGPRSGRLRLFVPICSEEKGQAMSVSNRLLLGIGRHMLPIPAFIWQRQAQRNPNDAPTAFMTPDHQRIRDHVVTELPIAGQPLSPAVIAGQVGLSLEQTVAILADLEKHLTFLFRDEAGAVVWAYPVTAAWTPHRFRANTGEALYAA